VALGVIAHLFGLEFRVLEDALTLQFQSKAPAVKTSRSLAPVSITLARTSSRNRDSVATGPKPLAVWSGNEALAMGGAAAGVKCYYAYPTSLATGVLHWMATLRSTFSGWGYVMDVLRAIIAVQFAGIDLDFDRAAAIGLADGKRDHP
jgi:2-oxoglutarate ferredoxin oxidoreductase subunit alpha